MRLIRLLPLLLLLLTCQREEPARTSLAELFAPAEGLAGRPEYLDSPFLTAGDRVYLVGHQDGTFPDLGWHVTGEMGGIWDHPVKLMDGFRVGLRHDGEQHCLDEADQFVNYPFGNRHIYQEVWPGLRVERYQFAPDQAEAVVVSWALTNMGEAPLNLDFSLAAKTDLRPVWLGERSGMIDATDLLAFHDELGAWVGKDRQNPWYVVWGCDRQPANVREETDACPLESQGQGATGELTYALTVAPGATEHLTLVIAGSYQTEEAALTTWQEVRAGYPDLFRAKRDRLAALAETAQLQLPDTTLQRALEWTRYNVDWLIREVPEQGRGLAAGSPDYPWWFGCDATYALQGVLASGRSDIAYSTLRLLKQLSETTNGNGRIIHEASTNGVVFNPGNINETPHFASMVWTVYEWTGDEDFLREFYPFVRQGLDWLLAENDADGNLLPDGFGMMEIHGLNSEMIDVAVYTQQGFADAARMATQLHDQQAAAAYQGVADRLRELINTDFWVPEFNSYADFIGTTSQALHLIDDAIVRADTLGKPWAVEELERTRARIAGYPAEQKQGFVLYHNWVVNTPMETGVADSVKAVAALETGSRFVNPFGVFVTGIDRDESAGTDDSSFAEDQEIFSYVGAVMTLPTGVQAIAENNYGRPDRALDYLQRLTHSFSYALPGSLYEVSPDFGMMTQAWTIYSLTVPVVRQFFGVQPRAYDHQVILQPGMPGSWDEAELRDLPIGDNRLSLTFERTADGERWTIRQSQGDHEVILRFPAGKYGQWVVTGERRRPEKQGGFDYLMLSGENLIVDLQP